MANSGCPEGSVLSTFLSQDSLWDYVIDKDKYLTPSQRKRSGHHTTHSIAGHRLLSCSSSLRCRGLVCSFWLWYFLIIRTYHFYSDALNRRTILHWTRRPQRSIGHLFKWLSQDPPPPHTHIFSLSKFKSFTLTSDNDHIHDRLSIRR